MNFTTKFIIVFLIIINILNVMDILTTKMLIDMHGYDIEQNPIFRRMFEQGLFDIAVFFKVTSVGLASSTLVLMMLYYEQLMEKGVKDSRTCFNFTLFIIISSVIIFMLTVLINTFNLHFMK